MLAVKIRMKRMGSKKKPFYRIIVADARSPRDGRFIEMLGYYDPMTEPANIKVDEDKLYKWLDKGAIPTDSAANVFKRVGLLERWQLLKSGLKISELDEAIEARRAKQPKAEAKEKVKLSRKAVAAAKKEEEEKVKAEDETAKAPEVVEEPVKAPEAVEEPVVEEAPKEEKPKVDGEPGDGK